MSSAAGETEGTPTVVVEEKKQKAEEKEKKKATGRVPLFEKKLPEKPKKNEKPKAVDPAPKGRKNVTINTNIRPITITDYKLSIYKYSVKVVYVFSKSNGQKKEIEMSASTKKGAEHDSDKARCARLYKLAIAKIPQLRIENARYYYDQQASLYTLKDLKNDERIVITFTDGVSKRSNFVEAIFTLEKVAASFQATTKAIGSTVNSIPNEVDQTLIEALNVITSAPALENENVITIGSCIHFLVDASAFGLTFTEHGKGKRQPHCGAFKGIRTLEGLNARMPSLHMTIDVKHSMFHPNDLALDELLETFERKDADGRPRDPRFMATAEASQAIKNLQVYTQYNADIPDAEDNVILRIRGLGLPSNMQKFDWNGVETTVAEYFLKHHKIRLGKQRLPTIETKGRGGQSNYFPPEVLRVCRNQIVSNDQMVDNQKKVMVDLGATKPEIRFNNTNTVAMAVGLIGNSDPATQSTSKSTTRPKARSAAPATTQSTTQGNSNFFKIEQPSTINGVILEKPEIVFAENRKVDWKKNITTDFSEGRGNPKFKFIIPKKLDNWVVNDAREDDPSFSFSIKALLEEMRHRGLTVTNPVISRETNMEALFKSAQKNKVQLIMFITDEKRDPHRKIKKLELEYDVLTQEVQRSIFNQIGGHSGADTRRNIVAKVNIKLGGLNFEIIHSELRKNRLIIGFETSGNSADVTTIGYCANYMAHHNQFSGGYIFTKRSADVYGSVINSVVQKCVTAAEESRVTNEIVIYINGLSEGQYDVINETYLTEVKKACVEVEKALKRSYDPRITIIAATKRHNARFATKGEIKGIEQKVNIVPGTVIDHTVVNPKLCEWYHAGSIARRGTTKTAKYTIICSTKDVQMESLEELTNCLCFNHQIINQTTSLPVPLMVAGRFAERGAMMLAVKGVIRKEDQKTIDFEKTNEALCPGTKQLSGTRYNA